jgi:hypothetical protein
MISQHDALSIHFATGVAVHGERLDLINIPGKASHKPKYTHAFRMCGGITAPIVTLPKRKWDGDRRSISADTQTVVNLEVLGDLVEDIVSQLLAMADGQNLTIILKGGTEALLRRYSL